MERRRRPAVRVGYDVTATTEKSFSVLALLGGPDIRREVLGAIEVANDPASTGSRPTRHAPATAEPSSVSRAGPWRRSGT